MKEKRVLPPTYLLTGILAMVGLHLTIPAGRFIPFLWRLSGPLLSPLRYPRRWSGAGCFGSADIRCIWALC